MTTASHRNRNSIAPFFPKKSCLHIASSHTEKSQLLSHLKIE